MTNRNYLPFRSARLYQDRKMAKWMGFFLSEHTTALHQPTSTAEHSSVMTNEQKILLLAQAYSNQLLMHFHLKDQEANLTGKIDILTPHQVTIRTEDQYPTILIENILTMQLADEIEYDYFD